MCYCLCCEWTEWIRWGLKIKAREESMYVPLEAEWVNQGHRSGRTHGPSWPAWQRFVSVCNHERGLDGGGGRWWSVLRVLEICAKDTVLDCQLQVIFSWTHSFFKFMGRLSTVLERKTKEITIDVKELQANQPKCASSCKLCLKIHCPLHCFGCCSQRMLNKTETTQCTVMLQALEHVKTSN